MNPRSTAILLLLAAALGAFVWFYEIEGEAGRKAAEDAEKRLFTGLEADDVQWVEMTSTDGVAVRAERSEGSWELVAPLRFPGEATAWDGIAAALTATTHEDTFDDPQPASVYGLGDGAEELRFGTASGDHSLRLGSDAPMGGRTYAAVGGDERVHTVASWRAGSLRKDLVSLRDKRLLDFEAGNVTRIVAEWPDARVVLVRDADAEGAWRVESPIAGPADGQVVADLLSDLAFLRADGFEDAPPDDAAAGLAPPAYAVELRVEDEAGDDAEPTIRTLRFALGDAVDEGQRFARAGQPSLYRVAASRLDDLPRAVSAYRFKQLADFDAADAKALDLVFRAEDGSPVTITATRGDGGWASEPEALAPGKLSRLVSELSGLTADAILAERVGPEEQAGLGLSPPVAAFTVRGGEGEAALAEVRLGTLQGGDGVVAQSGENPQLFRLPIDVSEFIPLNLEAMRNHFLDDASDEEEEITLPDDDALEGEGPAFDFDPAELEALLEAGGDRD